MQIKWLAPEGIPYLIATAAVTLIVGLFNPWLLLPGGCLLLFFAFFFRDPPRQLILRPDAWISRRWPGHGGRPLAGPGSGAAVSDKDHHFSISLQCPYQPCADGWHPDTAGLPPGHFHPAFKPHVSELNEQNRMAFASTN
jgi:hypothetical protein